MRLNDFVMEKVVKMETVLNGKSRLSNQCVPHILVEVGDTTYSICYFVKRNIWKVFFPYPSGNQTRMKFKTDNEVVEFFQDVREDLRIKKEFKEAEAYLDKVDRLAEGGISNKEFERKLKQLQRKN